MGRTLPSTTQQFLQDQEAFRLFRRALRRSDQAALDHLFSLARKHLAAASFAAHDFPFETFLLSMLLELHKETTQLEQTLAAVAHYMIPANTEKNLLTSESEQPNRNFSDKSA